MPGALLGGWVGERCGLTVPLGAAGLLALLLAALAWRSDQIRDLRRLPSATPVPADSAAEPTSAA